MSKRETVSVIELTVGLLLEHADSRFKTQVWGFPGGHEVELQAGHTHLGAVLDGELILSYGGRRRRLIAGDYFSVVGPATIGGTGRGMASSAPHYLGINMCGGPIEDVGRLRYIDGCSDTLLVPPVRKGDPCLNHLHFPAGVRQTPHTHPSVRTGLVYHGAGECIVPGVDPIRLEPGKVFIIPTDLVHSFNTAGSTMDVIAFHPDSDTGSTDDDHPMVNRTIVDGVSASNIQAIRSSIRDVHHAGTTEGAVKA
jgi:quercetin dioxygenase-like cupin family protein